MIQLQIKELFTLRGIEAPLSALMKGGIGQHAALKYLRGDRHNVNLEHIEILCKLLRCTPNDLFAWTPDKKTDDTAENPLQQIRKQAMPDLQKVISGLSLEEVRKRLES